MVIDRKAAIAVAAVIALGGVWYLGASPPADQASDDRQNDEAASVGSGSPDPAATTAADEPPANEGDDDAVLDPPENTASDPDTSDEGDGEDGDDGEPAPAPVPVTTTFYMGALDAECNTLQTGTDQDVSVVDICEQLGAIDDLSFETSHAAYPVIQGGSVEGTIYLDLEFAPAANQYFAIEVIADCGEQKHEIGSQAYYFDQLAQEDGFAVVEFFIDEFDAAWMDADDACTIDVEITLPANVTNTRVRFLADQPSEFTLTVP